jgi:glycerophosphoryl diester phosphodiesterase
VAIITFISVIASAQTKIIAHRGFSGIAPENTLIAFQKAIESGADYFELDVHKSSDGKIFVIHDKSINRTSSNDTEGTIAKMTCKDIKKVKVGYPEKFGETYKNEKIPTLKDALKLAKGKIKVCIEIKVHGIEKEVLKIINDLKMNTEVIIFSFYDSVLTKFHQLDTTIPILYLKNKADHTTIDYAKKINSNAIGVGYKTTITKEFLNLAHSAGIEIWKWTVNEEAQMQRLINLGVNGIITNYPDKAIHSKQLKSN